MLLRKRVPVSRREGPAEVSQCSKSGPRYCLPLTPEQNVALYTARAAAVSCVDLLVFAP